MADIYQSAKIELGRHKMSNLSPTAKSICFLSVIAIFYGINLYHYQSNISVLPEVATMVIAVTLGFFSEVEDRIKLRTNLWIAATFSMIISITFAVFHIGSSSLGTAILFTPNPARLALLLTIFDLIWVYWNRIWEKLHIS